MKEILITGENHKRVNIVFLSEGFTERNIRRFHTEVESITKRLFATQPYREYKSYFNVYSIEVLSIESGSDHPGTAIDEPRGSATYTRDTYFNGTLDSYGVHSLVSIKNDAAVYSVLRDNLPDWDVVFIMVNSGTNGGTATGTFAIFSVGRSTSDLAIHELGHAFANLADEYESIPGGWSGHEAANATAETRRDLIRWNAWISNATPLPTPEDRNNYGDVIGLFEGAVYNAMGWYRPKYLCKMRDIGEPFCEVCIEQTVGSIYNRLPPFESFEPFNRQLTLSENANLDFEVYTMKPTPNTIQTKWYLNGNLIASDTEAFHFRAADVDYGRHTIEAVVTDTTNLVKVDPDDLYNDLMGVVAWQIRVDSTRQVHDDDSELIKGFEFNQIFPNPVHDAATIPFRLPVSTPVLLKIYNVRGQLVHTLRNEQMLSGLHQIRWTTNRLAQGVYLIRLDAGPFSKVRKFWVVR